MTYSSSVNCCCHELSCSEPRSAATVSYLSVSLIIHHILKASLLLHYRQGSDDYWSSSQKELQSHCSYLVSIPHCHWETSNGTKLYNNFSSWSSADLNSCAAKLIRLSLGDGWSGLCRMTLWPCHTQGWQKICLWWIKKHDFEWDQKLSFPGSYHIVLRLSVISILV